MKALSSILKFVFNIALFVVLPWVGFYYAQFYLHPYLLYILFAAILFGWGYALYTGFDRYVKRIDSEEVNIVERYEMKKRDRVMQNLFCLLIYAALIVFLVLALAYAIPATAVMMLWVGKAIVMTVITKWWFFTIVILGSLIVYLIDKKIKA